MLRGVLPLSWGSRSLAEAVAEQVEASTASMIARPGKMLIQGAVSRKVRPSLSIVPHDGAGGWVPSPR